MEEEVVDFYGEKNKREVMEEIIEEVKKIDEEESVEKG